MLFKWFEFFFLGEFWYSHLIELAASEKPSMFSKLLSSCPSAGAFCFDVTNSHRKQREAVLEGNRTDRKHTGILSLGAAMVGGAAHHHTCARSHRGMKALLRRDGGQIMLFFLDKRSHSSPLDGKTSLHRCIAVTSQPYASLLWGTSIIKLGAIREDAFVKITSFNQSVILSSINHPFQVEITVH